MLASLPYVSMVEAQILEMGLERSLCFFFHCGKWPQYFDHVVSWCLFWLGCELQTRSSVKWVKVCTSYSKCLFDEIAFDACLVGSLLSQSHKLSLRRQTGSGRMESI
jgi:hypothetical protein